MHRKTFVARHIFWGLLAALSIHGAAGKSIAQLPMPTPVAEPQVSVLIVPRDTTKEIQMSTKSKIAQVRNENPKVARVQTKTEDPFAVLVTGLNPGTTRLILTDEKKNVDAVDILVPEDADIANEKMRKQALELVRKAVPTASIDIVTPGANTVIVSGFVQETQMIHPVLDVVRSVFNGASVVNNLKIGGVQQVQLEVMVALVNRSEARNLAVNFFSNGANNFFNSLPSAASQSATNSIAAAPTGGTASLASSSTVSFGFVNGKNAFAAYINALRTEGLAKVLAEPRVVTLSGRLANITSGGKIPVISSSAGGTSNSYEQFGTVVNFVPVVLGNGKIFLDVYSELSAPDASLNVTIASAGSVATAPGFRSRSAKVSVQMEDGQTLAIGGLIQQNVDATTAKIPVLGDLPFLGTAFRSVRHALVEEELMILVTPRLIDPLACNQLPKYLPGRETRNPDDFELFLEGILEAPRGQRNVFPDHCYRAAHLSDPAGVYPCGDEPHPWHRNGRGGNCGTGACGTGTCGTGTCGPNGCVSGNVTTSFPNHSTNRLPLMSETIEEAGPTPGNPLRNLPTSSPIPVSSNSGATTSGYVTTEGP